MKEVINGQRVFIQYLDLSNVFFKPKNTSFYI